MKTIAIVGLLALLLAGCATAGSLRANETIPAGELRKVDSVTALHEDCTSMGTPIVRITEQPQHGHIEIKPGKDYSNFAKINPRGACNRIPTPSVQIWYKPNPGYTGTDTFSVLTIFPNNSTRGKIYTLTVM